MQKLLSLILAVMLILSVCVSAAGVNVELYDAAGDIIRAYGSAKEGEAVSVMILNPGFDADDARANTEGAVAYYGKTRADKDGYSLEIPMYDKEKTGGEYTIFVSTANSALPDTDTFKFYFNDEKQAVVNKIGTSVEVGSLVEELYSVYGLADSGLYTKTPKAVLNEVFNRNNSIEKDVDKVFTYLMETLYTAAYKSGNDELITGGTIKGAEVLGLEGTDLYEDYLTLLSPEGIKNVNSKLISAKCDNIGETCDTFEEYALLHLICDYKDMGFGHIEGLFEKYADELKNAGIDTVKLNSVSNKNSVYLTLSNSSAKNLSLLADEFEAALLVADAPQGGTQGGRPSGGGASGGGAAGGGATGGGKVPSSGPSADTGYIHKPKNPFTDLASVSWADESVSVLYEMGVISGKDSKTFAPFDLVTREEFTKMIVLAFFGKAEEDEHSFSDVSGWSAPYIAAAEKKQIISGSDDGLFYPSSNITREQAASIVWRALSDKDYEGKSGKTFGDEKEISDWAKDSVKMLTGSGVLSGRENNMFCPKDNMTRAEAAKIIYYSYKLIEGGAV